MDDKDLIQLALGVTPPWLVKELNIDTSKKRMDIYLLEEKHNTLL